MKRLCRECEEPLEVDQDICRTCGANNPIPLPWYTFILGAAIVVVIVLLLVDFDDVRKVLGLQ
jgi:RNA polymerase subunit RPABC4/transcription elongation factor Spt4